MLDEGILDPPEDDRELVGKCRKIQKDWQCLKPKGHAGVCGKDSWVGPVEPSDADSDIPAGD